MFNVLNFHQSNNKILFKKDELKLWDNIKENFLYKSFFFEGIQYLILFTQSKKEINRSVLS